MGEVRDVKVRQQSARRTPAPVKGGVGTVASANTNASASLVRSEEPREERDQAEGQARSRVRRRDKQCKRDSKGVVK